MSYLRHMLWRMISEIEYFACLTAGRSLLKMLTFTLTPQKSNESSIFASARLRHCRDALPLAAVPLDRCPSRPASHPLVNSLVPPLPPHRQPHYPPLPA